MDLLKSISVLSRASEDADLHLSSQFDHPPEREYQENVPRVGVGRSQESAVDSLDPSKIRGWGNMVLYSA